MKLTQFPPDATAVHRLWELPLLKALPLVPDDDAYTKSEPFMVIAAAPTAITLATTIMTDAIFYS